MTFSSGTYFFRLKGVEVKPEQVCKSSALSGKLYNLFLIAAWFHEHDFENEIDKRVKYVLVLLSSAPTAVYAF